MIKILVVTPFFHPHIGGSQTYMEEIYANLLSQYPDVSVDVLAYTTKKGLKKIENYRSMKIYRLDCWVILKDQFCLVKPWPLLKFLFKNWRGYDLIHCSTRFFDSSWWAVLLGKLTFKKTLLTDHCADHPAHNKKTITFFSKVIDLTLVKLMLKLYDQVITTNKSTQKFLKSKFNVSSTVLYGGINPEIFYPQKKKNKTLKVVFVGRMIPSKGALTLFSLAKKLSSKANFIFVGPGPLVYEFKKDLKKQKHKNIEILGGFKRVEVAKVLRSTDILVHPSEHNEGFPNVLTEAGASKLAVIATNVGGSKEIIIDKKTGLLIPPKDPNKLEKALLTLIQNPSLREELSNNLYKYMLKNFIWEKSSQKLYKTIKKLLNS